MTTLLLILWIVSFVLLLFVLACRPERTRHSWSELNRRGDKAVIRRERLLGDVLALKRVLAGLLLVCLVLFGMALWQAAGVLIAIGIWLMAGVVARQKFAHSVAMKVYGRFEPRLLAFVEKVPVLGRLLRDDKYIPHDQRLESVEHLLQLVDSSSFVLTDEQRDMIHRGVDWHTTEVGSIMTPAGNVVSVKSGELLGPLVLDDLHRSGHYRFPVTRGNIDTIIGILDITDLLDVSTARSSQRAEQGMISEVLRVESDEPLPAALDLLQKGHQHMLVVVDDIGKTAGIVTLADITGSLLGKNA